MPTVCQALFQANMIRIWEQEMWTTGEEREKKKAER